VCQKGGGPKSVALISEFKTIFTELCIFGNFFQVFCPVCRDVISYDAKALDSDTKVDDGPIKYQPNSEMKQLQKKMTSLYLQQKAKGAIIDVEAERNKFLVPAVSHVAVIC
jgi:hypothetical protein